MPIEVVFKKGGSVLLKALVDQCPLEFGTDDIAVAKMEPGQHPLTWVALGEPGVTYDIAIVEPQGARFSHSVTLDRSMKDSGVQWFTV